MYVFYDVFGHRSPKQHNRCGCTPGVHPHFGENSSLHPRLRRPPPYRRQCVHGGSFVDFPAGGLDRWGSYKKLPPGCTRSHLPCLSIFQQAGSKGGQAIKNPPGSTRSHFSCLSIFQRSRLAWTEAQKDPPDGLALRLLPKHLAMYFLENHQECSRNAAGMH